MMKDSFKEITYPDTAAFAEKVAGVYDNFAKVADAKVVEIITK